MAQFRLLSWIGLILLILNLARPIQSQTQADSIIANEGKGNGSTQKSKIRIGIIGGGITGAGSAHWLHHYLDGQFDVDITLFERNNHVGGRLEDIFIGDASSNKSISATSSHRFENGGSILHESNEYAKYLVKFLNLTIESPPRKLAKSVGLWDGNKFVLELSGSFLWDAWAILWRYGMNYFQLSARIQGVAEQFTQIYRHQSDGRSYEGPIQLLDALGLHTLTQSSFRAWINDTVSDPLILNELAVASTRVNYGQSLDGVNGLAGGVGLIPMTDPRLWAVKEGNQRIVEGLLKYHKVKVLKDHQVIKITKLPSESTSTKGATYKVHSSTHDSADIVTNSFDLIVFALPGRDLVEIEFELDGEKMSSPSTTPATSPSIPMPPVPSFQVTHTTWIVGRLRAEPFHLKKQKDIPGSILTTESPSQEFTSITAYEEDDVTHHRTYKVFSRHPFTSTLVDKYFTDVDPSATHRTSWNAYPKYSPPESFAHSFRLFTDFDPTSQLWHPPALEHAASCIEMQLVSSRNTAIRIADMWKSNSKETQTPDHLDASQHQHLKREL